MCGLCLFRARHVIYPNLRIYKSMNRVRVQVRLYTVLQSLDWRMLPLAAREILHVLRTKQHT